MSSISPAIRTNRDIEPTWKEKIGQLVSRYREVRATTDRICAPLQTEDYVVQSMPDVSPTKWHLAHTTWFFETVLLMPNCPGYRVFNPHFAYLFNSYYLALGDRHCRQNRGLLSRPTVAEVYDYRDHVDRELPRWLENWTDADFARLSSTMELGLNHEQQHQELMLTDIKHVFWVNPLRPAYREREENAADEVGMLEWVSFPGGIASIGHDGNGFAFDNERPRHRVVLEPFAIGSRLITNGEYRAFMDDGGYQKGGLWLSDGWKTVQEEHWEAPQYWIKQDGEWWSHTLAGLRPVNDSEPVCHVSHYEADAFARWSGARLPTEAEWEFAAGEMDAFPDALPGHFLNAELFHPAAVPAQDDTGRVRQMFGDVWQWTASPYIGYPGFRPLPGAVGEYNGKFMSNQMVLRGASCATPRSHARVTYRNFFPPESRWQFMGIRLAKDMQ